VVPGRELEKVDFSVFASLPLNMTTLIVFDFMVSSNCFSFIHPPSQQHDDTHNHFKLESLTLRGMKLLLFARQAELVTLALSPWKTHTLSVNAQS
jgi:hypothetical protein